MRPLAELIRRNAHPGRLVWIGLRPDRRAAMEALAAGRIGPGGLEGDRARKGKRAVTLVQAEHLAVIGAFLGRGPVAPEVLRRNLVIAGINLVGLRGRAVGLGGAVLRITGPCAPCSGMEDALGAGGYAAVRGHGGMTAEVLAPGPVAIGDMLQPID
ncbi:MAG: sulfurase [Rhodobacteraceae bacterium]|nr:MAG: sulfurase [Paracoccaceae bacterium]